MKTRTALFLVILLLTVLPYAPATALRIAYNPAHQSNPAAVWQQARKAQQGTGQYCIVVEFPTGLQNNQALAMALQAPDESLREILGAVIIVCLRRDFMKKTFKGLRDDENVLLVDAGGRRLTGQTIDFLKTNTPAKFAGAARKLLFAENGKYLQAAADARAKAIDGRRRDRIVKALKDLDGDFKQRRAARRLLGREMPDAAPFVLLTRFSTDSIEVRESCKEILAAYSTRHRLKACGAPVYHAPYRR